MLVWKYFDPLAVAVLEQLKLRFTAAAHFNDPFEVVPHVGSLVPAHAEPALLDELYKNAPSLYSESLDHLASEGFPFAFFDQLLATHNIAATTRELLTPVDVGSKAVRLYGDVTHDGLARMADTFGRKFQQDFGLRFGVLCLSATPVNLLMWAHYAANHTGFALGFHSDHSFFKRADAEGAIGRLLPVSYSSRRPSVTMYDPTVPVEEFAERIIKQILLTKSVDWQHEQEYRFILPLNDKNRFPHDVDTTGRCLFSIPPEAVAGVILGARCSESTELAIRQRLASHERLAAVPIMRAQPSDTEFELLVARSM